MNATEIIYDYVEEIDPNLTCSICQSALVDPVTTTSCKHTFCRDCITTALRHNPQCPIDRSALTLHSLRDTEQLVKLMLDELKVRCAAVGCDEVMQRGLLLAHSRSCLKGWVKCDDPECGLSMARQRLPHHRAYECFQRKMQCRKCKVVLSFKAGTQHSSAVCDEEGNSGDCQLCGETTGTDRRLHRWSCPEAKVLCTHAARGCAAIITRAGLSEHVQSCPFEAISSYFAMNDARFAAVEERGMELSQTADALYVELDLVKGELDFARQKIEYLAEMIRHGRVGGSVRPRPATDPADSVVGHDLSQTLPVPGDGSGFTTPLNVPFVLPDVLTQHQDPSTPVEPRAMPVRTSSPRPWVGLSPIQESGFPTWAGITPRAAADIQARQRPLIRPPNLLGPPTSMRWRRTFGDRVFDQLPPDMPVDQAVRHLMHVSAELAEGMDSMERRNEIRSMTDGLRVSEEVASLRAIVNTMRQVVMMNHRSSSYRPMPVPSQPLSPQSAPGAALVETMTNQVTDAALSSSPPSSAPFSAYSAPGFSFPNRSPDTQPLPLEADEDETDPPRHGVRESVMFRANRASMGSMSSLVSTGAGRVGGRPMGIPPPEREVGRERSAVGRGSLRMRTNPISLLRGRLTQRENGPSL